MKSIPLKWFLGWGDILSKMLVAKEKKVMNYFIFIIVATFTFGIFFGAHYGIFVFLVHFFPHFFTKKWLLGIGIAILSLSFFASSIFAHYVDTVFSRGIYYAAGLWMGALVNILLAIAATGIIIGLARLLNISYNGSAIAAFTLCIATIISMYGAWNAMHPRIKNITIRIQNLPEQWQHQKIVQISDVHLGHIFRAEFLQGVVNQINAQSPRIVVITGDLFDGMDGNLTGLVQPLDNITAEKGVLFVAGNHETYLGTKKTFDILKQTRVRILNDEVNIVDGLAFVGISYPERGETKNVSNVVRSLRESFDGLPSILLYHSPSMVEEVAVSGVDAQLAGHTHRGQQFPFQLVTHIVHKGYDYGLHVLGKFTLYVSSGVGAWGPAMRIGTQSEIVVITLEAQ